MVLVNKVKDCSRMICEGICGCFYTIPFVDCVAERKRNSGAGFFSLSHSNRVHRTNLNYRLLGNSDLSKSCRDLQIDHADSYLPEFNVQRHAFLIISTMHTKI